MFYKSHAIHPSILDLVRMICQYSNLQILNPHWVTCEQPYIATFRHDKLVSIEKPTNNGYVNSWHYKYHIPSVLASISPPTKSYIKMMLISREEASNLTWSI